MNRAFFILITLFSVALGGCKQALPNPEESDPIYKDLEARAGLHAKDFDETKVKLTEAIAAKEKAEANSIEKREVEKDLAKLRVKYQDAEQWAHYYKIRVERRKIEDRITYRKAFAADAPWPTPGEYADYQVNRRLVESPRNWNLRVPRAASRLPSAATKPKAKPEGGEGE